MERLRSLGRAIGRLTRRAARFVVETHREIVWLNQARFDPERYVFRADRVPDTYADFLHRTSGILIREPSAARRARRAGEGSARAAPPPE